MSRESIRKKVAHVKSSKQTRDHKCHWPGCDRQVPPAYWGCRQHWYLLPRDIRSRIWATYRAGQEETMNPSREYLEAAQAAQEWIKGYLKRKRANKRQRLI